MVRFRPRRLIQACAAELGNNNVIVRITTPTFGAGLIEQIPDAAILANAKQVRKKISRPDAAATRRQSHGRPPHDRKKTSRSRLPCWGGGFSSSRERRARSRSSRA